MAPLIDTHRLTPWVSTLGFLLLVVRSNLLLSIIVLRCNHDPEQTHLRCTHAAGGQNLLVPFYTYVALVVTDTYRWSSSCEILVTGILGPWNVSLFYSCIPEHYSFECSDRQECVVERS